jgi:hypothetical protein
MSLNIIFWVLMVLSAFYGAWSGWGDRTNWGYIGPTWVLLALLGWKVYPIALN